MKFFLHIENVLDIAGFLLQCYGFQYFIRNTLQIWFDMNIICCYELAIFFLSLTLYIYICVYISIYKYVLFIIKNDRLFRQYFAKCRAGTLA